MIIFSAKASFVNNMFLGSGSAVATARAMSELMREKNSKAAILKTKHNMLSAA